MLAISWCNYQKHSFTVVISLLHLWECRPKHCEIPNSPPARPSSSPPLLVILTNFVQHKLRARHCCCGFLSPRGNYFSRILSSESCTWESADLCTLLAFCNRERDRGRRYCHQPYLTQEDHSSEKLRILSQNRISEWLRIMVSASFKCLRITNTE